MERTIWRKSGGLFIGLFCGIGMGAVLWSKATPARPGVSEVVRAQRFELVDKKGIVVASLMSSAEGETVFRLNDKTGKQRIVLNTVPEHWQEVLTASGIKKEVKAPESSAITLYDTEGRTRMVLTENTWKGSAEAATDGKTSLRLFNPLGKLNIDLNTSTPGEAQLIFGHETNQGAEIPAFFQFVNLSGSLQNGATLRLSGEGHIPLERQPGVGEVKLSLMGRNSLLNLPSQKSNAANGQDK